MYDFFIPYRSEVDNLKICKRLMEMGYTTIAWTIIVTDEDNIESIANKIELNPVKCELKQLFRLHIRTVKSSISFSKIKRFDILSVEPLTIEAMHGACEYMPIDIITLGNRKLDIRDSFLSKASQRHVRLEFLYGETITNESLQQQFFTNLGFVARTRCQKILLISCGSTCIRKSIDVQSILILVGFTHPQVKKAVQNLDSHLLKFHTKKVHGSAIEIIRKRPLEAQNDIAKKIKC